MVYLICDGIISRVSHLVIIATDYLVALHRHLHPSLSTREMSRALHIGEGAIRRGIESATSASLLTSARVANARNLAEFTLYGVQYTFYPVLCRGGDHRGVPTASLAPGISGRLVSRSLVWPEVHHGTHRGEGLFPIHESALWIAETDPSLYLLLAAIDLLRIGGARDREVAIQVIQTFFKSGSC